MMVANYREIRDYQNDRKSLPKNSSSIWQTCRATNDYSYSTGQLYGLEPE
jgi:hypothetical protein